MSLRHGARAEDPGGIWGGGWWRLVEVGGGWWRLVEVVQAVGGVGYAAATQGVRRFWKRAEKRPEMEMFANLLRGALGR